MQLLSAYFSILLWGFLPGAALANLEIGLFPDCNAIREELQDFSSEKECLENQALKQDGITKLSTKLSYDDLEGGFCASEPEEIKSDSALVDSSKEASKSESSRAE